MSDIQTWSNTAASNNATPPNGFPEGMAPSTVNDAARELMAAVSRYRSDTDGVNTSAGTNTITLAASRTMTAYAQGDLYTFKAGGTNTGATTLNVDSLGAKDVQFNGAACTGGEIVSGLMYTVVYDGTQFQLLNASSYPAIDITTLEVTNIKAKDGTASMTIANSTGVVTIDSAVLTTSDINGGTIDGATIGVSSTQISRFGFNSTNPVSVQVSGADNGPSGSNFRISYRDVIELSSVVSGVSSSHVSFFAGPSTFAAATTLDSYQGFSAYGVVKGAGSTVSNQYGFISGSTLTEATANYGFYSNVAASGVSRYSFYAAGTAPSYFGGSIEVASAGNIRITGTGSLGYGTGSGGTVTQATSRTTGVTLNKTNGAITLVSAAGTATWQSFTVTNSTVAATDVVVLSQKSGTDLYMLEVTAVAAGSFRISFATTGGTTTEQPVFNFAVIKAVTS